MPDPKTIVAAPGRMATLAPEEKGAAVLTWHNPTAILDPDALDVDESTLRMVVVPRKPGRYAIGATLRADYVQWWVIDAGEPVAPGRSFAWVKTAGVKVWGWGKAVLTSPRLQGAVLAVALAVGGMAVKGCVGPSPVDPVHPVDPPTPIVDPPAPIPSAGFRVLIVTETADLAKLPHEQVSVLTAKSIKDYLDLRCAEVNGQKEWRMWDKDVSTANVSKVWQDAFARPREALPWIVISNGVKGFEGPLPKTVADTLDLLKKFGGV